MLSGRTTTTVSMPAAGPMDLNEAGRPQWRELAPLFGLGFIGILIAGIGGVIMMLSRPSSVDSMGVWNVLGMSIGGAFAWGGYSMYKSLHGNITHGIRRYYDRVDAWNDAQLNKFIDGDGNVIAQQISEWAYNPLDLRSLLVAYAAILASNPNRLTVDQLCQQGLWIRIEHRDMKVLTFTQDSAAEFLNMLADAKIIAGRGPRQAGQLLLDQPADQVQRLIKLAGRNPAIMATMETLEG